MTSNQPILVIDDDRVFANVVSKMLIQKDLHSFLCFTMEDALERTERDSISLVITDIFMPGMGGLEGIVALRQRYGDVKIIAMSGGRKEQSSESALSEAREIGADWALQKPFSADQLDEAIAAVMGPPGES